MKFKFWLLTFIVSALLIGLLPTAFAQDIGIDPIVTGEAQPTAVATETTPPATAPAGSTDSFVVLSVWQIVAGLATAFSLGGMTLATGLGIVAYRLRTNPATMAAIEGLAASTPDSSVARYNDLMNTVQANTTQLFALAREALDKIPYADKTPEQRNAVLYPAAAEGVGAQSARDAAFREAANGNP